MEGIPQEIIERNRCESCGATLYRADDDELLDRQGFDIYRDRVLRYMALAVRRLPDRIEGSEHFRPNGGIEDGYHKDHVYSVRDGFENDVEDSVISSPSNLQVKHARKNLSKGRRSGCTLEELREQYDKFPSDCTEWLELVKESDEKDRASHEMFLLQLANQAL